MLANLRSLFPSDLQGSITSVEVAKEQMLFQQQEPVENIFWVESGKFQLISFSDRQTICHYSVGAGESLAETALYFETYTCTAIASQPSRVAAIPKLVFLEALRRSPILSERYLAYLTHRLFRVKRLLELRSIRPARDRLLHYLSQQRRSGQPHIPLSQSLKSLAIELGLSPEGLSRTLTRLESERIITRKKGAIVFNDK